VSAREGHLAPPQERERGSGTPQVKMPASEGGRYTNEDGASWGVRAALFALDCYKSYLSVLFAGTCRFEPTCSRYAYEAIERFGVARGVWLGLKRLGRCHPLSRRFGYDPVPEKQKEMRVSGYGRNSKTTRLPDQSGRDGGNAKVPAARGEVGS
jgi:putative membrane protein insertion efficiency factor